MPNLTTPALLLIGLSLATGCVPSTTVTVADLDNGHAPIAGATVERYAYPRTGQPWPTTPTQTLTTDANGAVVINSNSGRFVARAPGKPAASYTARFAPNRLEIGVGGDAGAR